MAKARRETTRTPGVYKLVGRRTTYEARWRFKNPETGKRDQDSAAFDKLEDAEAHLDKVRAARRSGKYVPASAGKVTFHDMFEGWLKAKRRKQTTIDDYRAVYHKWFQDWDETFVGTIDYDEVCTIMARVVEAGRAPATIKRVYTLLRGTLEHARKSKKIEDNPADAYRDNLASPRRTREPCPINAGQVAALAHEVYDAAIADDLDATTAKRFRLFVQTAAWSGLRAGELTGLRLQDVHPLTSELQVIQTVYPRQGGGWRVDTPKSQESANRTPPLPPTLTNELITFAQDLNLEPDDFLFGTDGTPLSYKHFYKKYFKPAAKECGLPIRFHDLRHTFAALKLSQGYRLDQLKKWMGHSSIKVTIDLYGTWAPEDDDARRKADDAAFLAATPTATVVPLRPASTGTEGATRGPQRRP